MLFTVPNEKGYFKNCVCDNRKPKPIGIEEQKIELIGGPQYLNPDKISAKA